MRPSQLLAVAAATMLGCAGALRAQDLYSQAVPDSGTGLTISIKIRNLVPSTPLTISTSATTQYTVSAPTSVTSDASGYAAFVMRVTTSRVNCATEEFSLTLGSPTLPSGQLVRPYLLKCANSRVVSAWPEFIMLQGAFCSPVESASAMLQIERTVDLDGDGIYGDIISEGSSLGAFEQIDFPSEFSMDTNAQGTMGCLGGNPPGLFWPGSATRQCAFVADNRSVTGTCNFTTVMNFLQDSSFSASFNGQAALFMTASGSDIAYICRDTNNDGAITDSEINTFFDPDAQVASQNYSPDGVAVDRSATNRVYWISDKSGTTGPTANEGLWRLTDANGNDSIDAGEFVGTWVGATPTVTVEGISITPDELEGLHVDSTGAVLVNHTALGAIFRWADANADGVAQTGEVTNWLNYNTLASVLPTVSADFGGFPSWAVGTTYFGFNLIQSFRLPLSGDVFFVSPDGSTAPFGGMVFKCVDGNGDGDVNDAGEVVIWLDPSLAVGTPTWVSGMDVGGVDRDGNGVIFEDELFVYVATPQGPFPTCGFTSFTDLINWRYNDSEFDGTANEIGDSMPVSLHPTGAFNRGLEVLPGPSDGGFNWTFHQRSGQITSAAATCIGPSGDYVEMDFARSRIEEGMEGTPFATNRRYVVRTRGHLPSSGGAGLILGVTPIAVPFFPPCTVGVIPNPPVAIFPSIPDATGTADFPTPIPDVPGATIYMQAFSLQGTSIVLGETAQIVIN
ncbi:MAG: hypothetical protein AAF628_37565 [Planctomycetota bacterium]